MRRPNLFFAGGWRFGARKKKAGMGIRQNGYENRNYPVVTCPYCGRIYQPLPPGKSGKASLYEAKIIFPELAPLYPPQIWYTPELLFPV